MLKRNALLLTVAFFAASYGGDVPAVERLPPRTSGTFVQRKTLADVGVTLVSSGTFRFDPGRFFEWRTVEPLPTCFFATPTNWSFTADGVTAVHPLATDVRTLEQVFAMKEMAGFVEKVETEGEPFPRRVLVRFRNGDRHDISLKPDGQSKP